MRRVAKQGTLQTISVRLDSTRGGSWNFKHQRPANHYVCDAATRVTAQHNVWGVARTWDDPLEALNAIAATGDPPSRGETRLVGYLSYDLGRLLEPSLDSDAAPSPDGALPLFEFSDCWSDEYHAPVFRTTSASRAAPPWSTFSRQAYIDAVARVIDYVRAGDVYQVNLSQRFTAGCAVRADTIYERLCAQAPAAYGALLDYGDHALVSNSPELFLRVEPLPDGRRRVVTRPVKGTRPRLPGMDVELRDSAKDQAELAMIVDLERNDLGRVCEVGSVRVVDPRVIEEHPTVYHGVATIEGVLRDDVTLVDLLRATFPCGSVTGAPKIRAMQIIDELEPVRRGPYCGAIGYVSSTGVIEFNVAIRTMTIKDGLVDIPVGGGIVADSDPAAEYDETLVKAKAMFAALGVEQCRI
jgi:anthranilate/para-aminobenzoate synthase component I